MNIVNQELWTQHPVDELLIVLKEDHQQEICQMCIFPAGHTDKRFGDDVNEYGDAQIDNARKIALLPDLLALLKGYRQPWEWDIDGEGSHESWVAARDLLIAKAEGTT